jgi:hypothetical protein
MATGGDDGMAAGIATGIGADWRAFAGAVAATGCAKLVGSGASRPDSTIFREAPGMD